MRKCVSKVENVPVLPPETYSEPAGGINRLPDFDFGVTVRHHAIRCSQQISTGAWTSRTVKMAGVIIPIEPVTHN